MRISTFTITLLLACNSALLGAETIPAESEVGSAVPESSVAILLGGLLWFVLLRKRA